VPHLGNAAPQEWTAAVLLKILKSHPPSLTRLTMLAPWRSVEVVMKDSVYRNRRVGTACIAILTTLAVLIVPFCGRICAASTGCENGAAIADSGESCHHGAVSNRSGSGTDLASAKSCNQHELPAVIGAEQKPSSLLSVSASIVPSGIQQTRSSDLDLVGHSARGRNNGDPPQASLPAPTTSVLRI
jgi:hypothetical protein